MPVGKDEWGVLMMDTIYGEVFTAPDVTLASPEDLQLVQAIIVDIDGTLALHTERSPYDMERVGEDVPNMPIVALVQALSFHYQIILASGRYEKARRETAQWLARMHVPYVAMFMRADKDNRPDYIIKQEMYEQQIAPKYSILAVLDDRDQTVAMWRRIGLTCLQVAYGDF